jgi:hypothetical protein
MRRFTLYGIAKSAIRESRCGLVESKVGVESNSIEFQKLTEEI